MWMPLPRPTTVTLVKKGCYSHLVISNRSMGNDICALTEWIMGYRQHGSMDS